MLGRNVESMTSKTSIGWKRNIALPSYEIQIPKPDLVTALKIIKEKGGKISKKEMTKYGDDVRKIRKLSAKAGSGIFDPFL
jgi:hypothetical protein